MQPLARLAGVALAAVLAVGGFMHLFGRDGGIGTQASPTPTAEPTATPSPPEPTAASGRFVGACQLVTSGEAAELAGDPGLGALPTQTGSGNETTCSYADGGGDFVLRVELARTGGAAAFASVAQAVGIEPVADLGDAAAYDPSGGVLSVLQGDSLVAVQTARRDRAEALEVAAVALPRLSGIPVIIGSVRAQNIAFFPTRLVAPSNTAFAIDFRNQDPGEILHTVAIQQDDGLTVIQPRDAIPGGQVRLYVYDPLPPGTYAFICTVHPIPGMTGVLTIP
jgi:hypothetical protein